MSSGGASTSTHRVSKPDCEPDCGAFLVPWTAVDREGTLDGGTAAHSKFRHTQFFQLPGAFCNIVDYSVV